MKTLTPPGQVAKPSPFPACAQKISDCLSKTLLGALVIIISATTGCQHTGFPRIINEAEPLSASRMAGFGRIGLLPTQTSPEFGFEYPETPGMIFAATTLNTFGAMESSRSHTGTAKDELRVIGLELLLSGTVGVMAGIFQGVPKEKQREYQAAMIQALQEEPLPQAIQSELLRLAAQNANPTLTLLPHANGAWPSNHSANTLAQFVHSYRALTNYGTDTILLTQVANQWFEAPVGLNTEMTFAITLDVEVIRSSDGALLYVNQFEYRGRAYTFTRWAENNARHFRKEIHDAKNLLAENIAELFIGSNHIK